MCTGIRIYAENGDVVFARTLEFDTPVPVVLGYFPRNQDFTGETSTGTDGMKWTNQYAFGGNVSVLEGGHSAGADGLNEKGLIAGCFNLPGFTEFSPVTEQNRSSALASWQVVLYALGNYATADEAKAGILAGDLIVADTDFPFTPTTRGQLPQHVRIGDATGKTYIFEWHTANEPPAVVESPSGVITNPPRFEFHLSNWGYFKNLTPYNPSGPVPADGSQDYKLTMGDGYLGLPGGSNSPDRFIRASVYSRDAYPGKTGADSVWTAWHVMNCFDVPRGILRNVGSDGVESCEFALYIGVADTKNLKYYFRTYQNPQIYELDLTAQDPDGTKLLTDSRPGTPETGTVPAVLT